MSNPAPLLGLDFISSSLQSAITSAGVKSTIDVSSHAPSELDARITKAPDFGLLYTYCFYVDRFGDTPEAARTLVSRLNPGDFSASVPGTFRQRACALDPG
jgi:hypothetical protein